MDVSINWYGDILGFTQVFRTFVSHINCDIAVLRNGSFEIELFHHRDSRSLPKDRLHSDEDMITQGTKHMCFRVTELDSFVEKFRQKAKVILRRPENKETHAQSAHKQAYLLTFRHPTDAF